MTRGRAGARIGTDSFRVGESNENSRWTIGIRQGCAAVNGSRLYFETAGSGSPIVFLHGFAADNRLFDDQFDAFARQFQAVRYDLRGFGKSDLPSSAPYRHCDDLKALLEYLGIERADLVGQSRGGAIVVDFALEFPGMTRALILLDSALGGFEHSPRFQAWLASLAAQASKSGVQAANALLFNSHLLESARAKPDVARRLERAFSEYSGWHWVNPNPETPLDPPAARRLEQIRAPTLIVTGERSDPDYRAIADLLNERIIGSRRIVLRGVGHLPNMEDPETVNQIVLSFLGGLQDPAPKEE